jgi:hypothetical protein
MIPKVSSISLALPVGSPRADARFLISFPPSTKMSCSISSYFSPIASLKAISYANGIALAALAAIYHLCSAGISSKLTIFSISHFMLYVLIGL